MLVWRINIGNANLVLKADRSMLPNRDATGEADSLYGKINFKAFGDRAFEDKKPTKTIRKTKKKSLSYSNILAATQDFEQLDYKPKTKQTKETYELILVFLQRFLGDAQQDVLISACDAVLLCLKNENIKDFDKHKQVEDIVSAEIPSEEFSQLLNLSKKLLDYGDTPAPGVESSNIDEDGVAVLFDEEETDSDEYDLDDMVSELIFFLKILANL